MACDIKILIKDFKGDYLSEGSDENKQPGLTLMRGLPVGENPSFVELAKQIANLDKATRDQILDKILASKTIDVTSKIRNEHKFIGNTTIVDIYDKWPDLKDTVDLSNVSLQDNFQIVQCSNLVLNGQQYYGIGKDADTNESIFFIQGKYSALKLLHFLEARNLIRNNINNDLLQGEAIQKALEKEDLSEEQLAVLQNNLNKLCKQFKKDPKTLLLDFLESDSTYGIYQDENGNSVYPKRLLNEIIYTLKQVYNPDSGKSDIELGLDDIKQPSKNKWEYKVNSRELYELLTSLGYFTEMSESDFYNTSQEKLNTLLSNIFKTDPRLIKLEVDEIQTKDTKSSKVELKEYPLTPEGIRVEYSRYKSSHPDAQEFEEFIKSGIRNIQSVLKEIYKEKFDRITITRDKETKQLSIKGIVRNKIDSVNTTKTVVLKSRYKLLGDLYGFSYDSIPIFAPVDEDGVEKGMYKGVYIYKYFDKKSQKTHYAVSRNIISPKTYASTYSSLDAAKHKAELMNSSDIIIQNDLHTIKTIKGRPRTVKIEQGTINVGQLITCLKGLEHSNPDIYTMPEKFRSSLLGNMATFYTNFSEIENIENLNTPEEASAFIYLLYDAIVDRDEHNRRIVKTFNLEEWLANNDDAVQSIINKVINAERESFIVEDYNKAIKTATIKYVENNGTHIDVDGKINEETSANQILTTQMDEAMQWCEDNFGVKVKSLSQSQINDFIAKHNLKPSISKLRAFVHGGTIYINSSNSNISDLFHELSHIFLGVIRANNPEAYQAFIEKQMSLKKVSKNFNYIDRLYHGFSYQDKVEECVVDAIADDLFARKSLAEVFDGNEFVEAFEQILNTVPNILKDKPESDSFTQHMSNLISKNQNKLKRNMRISQLIKSKIEDKTIKEKCK